MVLSQGLSSSCRKLVAGARRAEGYTEGGDLESVSSFSLRASPYVLSPWTSLSFLITWRLDSKSEHPKEQDRNAWHFYALDSEVA